ncbi:MAG: MFS transporter [Lentisphaeria bacterium]|nr:MFS transporter [Lentisphaeria bacterium]
MLWRFCLYGFLKNQRYFEPFFVLALRQRGWSFFLIGLLVAFREISVNVLEVPTGVVADVWGRRRSMILSFVAYVVSFLVFGFATSAGGPTGSPGTVLLFAGMFLFAIGESFRTGTHKAMIFAWLRSQNRTSERTKVYGYTRSWSKIGTVVSVALATAFVFLTGSYSYVFTACAIPYLLGIVNFLGYPQELDGTPHAGGGLGRAGVLLRDALLSAWRHRPLRRLVLESMGYEGVYTASKDYVQPVLKQMAIGLAAGSVLLAGLREEQRAAVLVLPVYAALAILAATASRNAHRFVRRFEGRAEAPATGTDAAAENRAAHCMWLLAVVVFAVMLPTAAFGVHLGIVACFLVLEFLQNLWRPLHISRFDAVSPEQQGATVLSIESQAKSVATMLCAPVLGLAVDALRKVRPDTAFWPIAAVGLAISLFFYLRSARK